MNTAPCIVVGIPEKCCISADCKRTFPCSFFFSVTYGYLPPNLRTRPQPARSDNDGAIAYPKITIAGFEKLFAPDRIGKFLDDLKKTGGEEWSIRKASASNDIVLKFTGDRLAPDFSFRASTESFVSDATENGPVTFLVTVMGFPGIEDYSCCITTMVRYAPWAKSLGFSKPRASIGTLVDVFYQCEGDGIDKQLSQNGVVVDSGRSPYAAAINGPSLFTLRVFNPDGQDDRLQASIDVEPPKITSFKVNGTRGPPPLRRRAGRGL